MASYDQPVTRRHALKLCFSSGMGLMFLAGTAHAGSVLELLSNGDSSAGGGLQLMGIGTARSYTLHFDDPRLAWHYVLELGQAAEGVQVRLNGINLERSPGQSPALRLGSVRARGNVLEIESTVWPPGRVDRIGPPTSVGPVRLIPVG